MSGIFARAFLGLGVMANIGLGKAFGEGSVMWSLTVPRWPQRYYISLSIEFASKLQVLLPLDLNLFEAHAAAKLQKGDCMSNVI